jgi:peptide-methionine (R)-S-oxide reductase
VAGVAATADRHAAAVAGGQSVIEAGREFAIPNVAGQGVGTNGDVKPCPLANAARRLTVRTDRGVNHMLSRRFLLAGASGLAAMTALGAWAPRRSSAGSEGAFEVVRTEAEWRDMLTEEQYAVLREEATERAWTSSLNDEKRAGTYHCVGCANALYDAATKFESGTGWPSFYEALPGAVGTKDDRTLWMLRTEVHCARCGGHLGHVFDDGPPPTGLRHCINGVALAFRPADGA